ncbi:hypothetical protein DWU89_19480 [Parabacteroides acidifaciens]|uniref:Uncharacterized protein n=1 Tax=Parabacteroides acidifaciens TaxID=2290935 RepID=A0A3D8HAB8_9BACT|nr:hypothetical protein DWU89_19480 [Parabacteroides acidifaciens]
MSQSKSSQESSEIIRLKRALSESQKQLLKSEKKYSTLKEKYQKSQKELKKKTNRAHPTLKIKNN